MALDIDVAAQVGAVVREVRDGERDGAPTRTVVATRRYPTTVADLWDAITSAERIPRWFLPVTGELRLGGRYQLEGNAGGEITACQPPAHLALTWEFGGDVTWVEVRLAQTGDSAELVLEHTAHIGPHWDQFGPGAVGIGWELGLMGLDLHLRSGAAIDRAAYAEWEVSDQAKDLVRRSSAGWRDADAASGTPPEVATAAADRTAEAYTSEA
jgi:uncharacterized protein YndB with AHSA1/START domain